MQIRNTEVKAHHGKIRAARTAMRGTSALALTVSLFLFPSAAMAGQVANAGQASEESVSDAPQDADILVTGSRIRRDGFQAPTPVAVLNQDEILSQSQPNIADYVNTMPVFSSTATPGNSGGSVSSGTAGINVLDLRGLGGARTLVLFDGQRSVASTITGLVDVNTIPQALISRVEVVTGGASAAYGSDAVSGVVNFILNRDFTGLKGEVSGGITTYGDNENFRVSLAGGAPFAGGRGHILFSGEVTAKAGIFKTDRAWNKRGWGTMLNPAYAAGNGQPERLVLTEIGGAHWAEGSLISSGPLMGTAFGPGGSVYNYNYGDLVSGINMRGGEWRASEVRQDRANSMDSKQDFETLFARVSYDVTDDTNAFIQASFSNSNVRTRCCPQFDPNNLVVRVDNGFLPETVRARAVAAGASTLRIGTLHPDLPDVYTDNNRKVLRLVGGLEGSVSALGRDWQWNAYYQFGRSRNHETVPLTYMRDRLALAIDAVRDPATGTVVCRSTLSNPGNGCVPYNLFGVGVNSQAAINYVVPGYPLAPWRRQTLKQEVFSASTSGDLFQLPAGPVSISFGGEHRRESVSGVADAESAKRNFLVGNFLPSFGKFSVTEGFLEAVVPITDADSRIGAFELNGAARATDYSTSGYVTTWKIGSTYRPIRDVLFRATYSQDIRAPNLADQFQAGSALTNSVIDPFNGSQPTSFLSIQTGNANLDPERAKTLGAGVVVSPSFLPGFSASIDYFDITIKDAIGAVNAQNIVDFCFQGNATFCNAITRGINSSGVNVITQILISPFNTTEAVTRGYDIEASYRIPIGAGSLTLRALATRTLESKIDNGINPPDDAAGALIPKWRFNASAIYDIEALRASVTARGRSKGKQDNDWIVCTSSCPTSNTVNVTINGNTRDSTFYIDTSLSYEFFDGVQAFFNTSNLFNKAPARAFPGPGGTPFYVLTGECANGSDCQGRVFRAGIRFEM